MKLKYDIINVFTGTFDQFNASLLNKRIDFFKINFTFEQLFLAFLVVIYIKYLYNYFCLMLWILIAYILFSSKIFPNKDLKILRQCVSIRDKLLQRKYEEHKVNVHLHYYKNTKECSEYSLFVINVHKSCVNNKQLYLECNISKQDVSTYV